MQDLPRPLVIYGTAAALAVAMSLGAVANAQTAGSDETVEEIIVVGTRRQDRTATDTPVPVDVFDEQLLETVSSNELLEVLQTLVPSLNVERWPRGDGNSFIRPPKLRGLDSDKTLVLAGPSDLVDEEEVIKSLEDALVQAKLRQQNAALQGESGALLLLASAEDGSKLAEYRLDSPPVFDGMAIAGKRLYMASTDGKIVCFGEER